MKKSSLMGASVVAAALLAVAPIAAPAISSVSGTQTVSAATVAADDNSGTINKLLGTLSSPATFDLSDGSASDALDAGMTALGILNDNNGTSISSAATITSGFEGITVDGDVPTASDNFLKLLQPATPNNDTTPYHNIYNYKLGVTVTNVDGGVVTTDDFANYSSQLKKDGGTMNVAVNVYNPTSSKLVGTKSFKIVVTPKSDSVATTLNILSNPLTVQKGEPVTNYNFGYKAGLNITDQNGNAYDWFANGNHTKAVIQENTKSTATGTVNGTWNDASGTFETQSLDDASGDISQVHTPVYRQKITLTLPSDTTIGHVYVNGVYTTANNDGGVAKVEILRDVNVTTATANTTSEKLNGVVTVNPDVKYGYAQLHTADGKLIPARVLPANTAWYTDTKLTTLADGKQYYRVSTKEYVSADDVNYAAKSDDSSSDSSAITNTVAEDGAFTTKNDGIYAATFTIQDGKFVSNPARILAPGTSWRYDKKANFGGDTYYKVTPTLWLSSVSGSAQPY